MNVILVFRGRKWDIKIMTTRGHPAINQRGWDLSLGLGSPITCSAHHTRVEGACSVGFLPARDFKSQLVPFNMA